MTGKSDWQGKTGEAAIRSRTDAVAEEMMTGPDADSED